MMLTEQLAQLDMWSDQTTTGLLWTKDIDAFPPDERIIVEDAIRYHADAVYVRRFSGGKTAVPQVYIYDLESSFAEDQLKDTRVKLWNFGQVPMMMAFSRGQVRIFNCYQPPVDQKGNFRSKPFETIQLAADTQKQIELRRSFSGKALDNGSFWDGEYGRKFKRNESAYVQLLNQLKKARKMLIGKKILSAPVTDRLLILSIMIKYLEDRTDQEGNSVFPPGFFSEIHPEAKTYHDILRHTGACVTLFDRLGGDDYFNGEFFKISSEERQELEQTNLSAFADLFVSGKVGGKGDQYHLWQLYSFEDLPIELISNIYEEFLLDEKNVKKEGAVYTPPYLVDLLIDECMPIDEPQETFKVIDPACGSGVFLVAAFKRMVIWWRQLHHWQRPGKDHLPELKKILRENIFGVDKEESAVKLAMFSLTLALCDELSPKEIWEELKFENLKDQNLICADFFDLVLEQRFSNQFDLVIGNPPFLSELSEPAKRVEKAAIAATGRLPVPDQQLALLFLEQAPEITRPEGKVCLIIKSGPLLYNKGSLSLRGHIFAEHQVDYIFDFTPLESVLFTGASVETAAIFLTNQAPQNEHLYHITFRRTQASREKVYFELDAYDIHRVRYEDALHKRLVWKANLLGGGRLHYLLDKVEGVRTLEEFLKERTSRKENRWYVGEGFITGNRQHLNRIKFLEEKQILTQQEQQELEKLIRKYPKADYLTGMLCFPTEAFDETGIDNEQIKPLKEERFIRPRNRKLYEPPHLLIKEHVKEEAIPVAYREDYLTFRHQIIAIHAPWEEKETLLEMESRLSGNRNYAFWSACISPKYLIDRASALLKNDLDNLPFPEDESDLAIDDLEQILIDDVLDYHVKFRREGENSDSVKPTSDEHLSQFGDTFLEVLNSVYGQFKAHAPIKVPAFVIYPFYFGDQPQIDIPDESDIENHLETLIQHQQHRNLRINRILRIYDHNLIYLVKPDQIRYWLRSVAIRDADETFADLVAQGY